MFYPYIMYVMRKRETGKTETKAMVNMTHQVVSQEPDTVRLTQRPGLSLLRIKQ